MTTNIDCGMNVIGIYSSLCQKYSIPFNIVDSVLSYDESTLFCPAGMQQYKSSFGELSNKTVANSQKCIRLNDFDEISDGIHALSFDMIGLFSFREWSVPKTIDFFLEYLSSLDIKPSYITVHPDREGWERFYPTDIEVRISDDCKWTDGEIGGYCTEFFVEKDGIDVEIGNIVNPLGHSIDVGFGKQRIEHILGAPALSSIDQLRIAAIDIINSGIRPSANKHGYILRKILREIYLKGGELDHEFYKNEKNRMIASQERYEKLKDKYPNQTKDWWWDTHGVIL